MLPKERAWKLCPKWVGPYKVLEVFEETSNYVLELPEALLVQRLHARFHVLLLQPYKAAEDGMFPNQATLQPYDFGVDDKQEWSVEDLIDHWWGVKGLEFKVCWSLRDTTWEMLDTCKDLEALDRYLEVQGMKHP